MTTLDLIGSSSRFRALLNQIDMVAPVDSAVLIQGETGTGKEVIARTIHEASPRRNHRFVALNCAAIPSALLESELFGHERGAFTGAWAQTNGRFQMADGGTLFLDEIGDMPLELQPKLLRALQEREFERLGGEEVFGLLGPVSPVFLPHVPSGARRRNAGIRSGASFPGVAPVRTSPAVPETVPGNVRLLFTMIGGISVLRNSHRISLHHNERPLLLVLAVVINTEDIIVVDSSRNSGFG
jgi:transcriptional regulator with PAS, ATPase and Fis domain